MRQLHLDLVDRHSRCALAFCNLCFRLLQSIILLFIHSRFASMLTACAQQLLLLQQAKLQQQHARQLHLYQHHTPHTTTQLNARLASVGQTNPLASDRRRS